MHIVSEASKDVVDNEEKQVILNETGGVYRRKKLFHYKLVMHRMQHRRICLAT